MSDPAGSRNLHEKLIGLGVSLRSRWQGDPGIRRKPLRELTDAQTNRLDRAADRIPDVAGRLPSPGGTQIRGTDRDRLCAAQRLGGFAGGRAGGDHGLASEHPAFARQPACPGRHQWLQRSRALADRSGEKNGCRPPGRPRKLVRAGRLASVRSHLVVRRRQQCRSPVRARRVEADAQEVPTPRARAGGAPEGEESFP